jgi:hypothetical protein
MSWAVDGFNLTLAMSSLNIVPSNAFGEYVRGKGVETYSVEKDGMALAFRGASEPRPFTSRITYVVII